VKRLHSDEPKAFKDESNILKRLSREPHSHPHLITLLATFEQRQHQYLVFPWAESDLENYWKRAHHVKGEKFSVWLVRQCKGIAEALSQIHRYRTTSATILVPRAPDKIPHLNIVSAESSLYDSARSRTFTLSGRHGDIRPQNILWYHSPVGTEDFGTLKLSDFGSTRFRREPEMPEEKRKSMAISWTYLSPECQLPDASPSIQCDVWALGCVFLEFVCWYFAGYDGLGEFERQRKLGYDSDSFFTIVRDENTERRIMRDGTTERRPECYAKVKETVLDVGTSVAVTVD
jgi:serine/threonine protein kinase